jgi:hypothetical protein
MRYSSALIPLIKRRLSISNCCGMRNNPERVLNLLKISLIGRAEAGGSKATSLDRQGFLYKAGNAAEKDVKRCARIVPTSFDPKVHPVGVIHGADVSGKSS